MDTVWIQAILSLGVGLGLAAATGLRIFLPLLLLGAASRMGLVPLSEGFAWLASDVGLGTLGVATVLEIGAYYFPWLDHLLDVIAGPAAVLAGIVVTAAVTTELPPALRWAAAIIAGGGTAGAVQGLTTLARLKSTATTGGLANPVLATIEWIGSLVTSFVAIFLPAVAILLVALVFVAVLRIGRRVFRRRPTYSPNTSP
jgi:hypothetical protein